MNPLTRQYDIIDVDLKESKKPIVKDAVDFFSISKLQCYVVVKVLSTSVEVLAVFSKKDLAKGFLMRLYEKGDRNDVQIIDSVLYNDRSIIDNMPVAIQLKKKMSFDADFKTVEDINLISYPSEAS